MTGSDFLAGLLASQKLEDGCPELIALDAVRDQVERLIRATYGLPSSAHLDLLLQPASSA